MLSQNWRFGAQSLRLKSSEFENTRLQRKHPTILCPFSHSQAARLEQLATKASNNNNQNSIIIVHW